MGREAEVEASFSWIQRGKARSGKLMLETDGLIFRGEPRVVIDRAQVLGARVEGASLIVDTAQGAARFGVGSTAPKWLDALLHPPTLLDKLGIGAADHVSISGDFDAGFRALLAQGAASVREGAPVASTTVVLARVQTAAELARVAELAGKIRGATALWVIHPKGKASPLPESEVMAALRATGLKDNKTCRFDDALTGLRFVVPKAAR